MVFTCETQEGSYEDEKSQALGCCILRVSGDGLSLKRWSPCGGQPRAALATHSVVLARSHGVEATVLALLAGGGGEGARIQVSLSTKHLGMMIRCAA